MDKKIKKLQEEKEKAFKAVSDKVRIGITDFRVEVLSRYNRKVWIALASSGLCLILVFCVILISCLNPPDNTKKQIARVAEETNARLAAQKSAYSQPATGIFIDGREVVAVANEANAQTVLEQVLAHYQTASSGSEILEVKYNENIEVAQSSQSVQAQALSVQEAVNYIVTGSKEPKTYTVAAGDNMWDIAVKNGITVNELIDANPTSNPDRLQIGQTLNLFECKPYVHVRITEKISTTETIACGITYEETDVLWKGEVRVKSAGVNGSKDVVYQVISENGVETSRTVLSSTVTSQPVSQVALKGTKPLSILVGTGDFANPMNSLQVSSYFGSRGRSFHAGVDFHNPKGTAIYAVDQGTVTFADYSGTYGNVVKIAHGNGYETWYAHCDTMLVSVGTQVSKGQKIATVGRTGRATGYHLHFEVRYNGVAQNPLNYLN